MEKLVRDYIQSFSEQVKDGRKFRIATKEEMPKLLAEKLQEEVNEVLAATSGKHLTEELADVMDVIQAIADFRGISIDDVYDCQYKKRLEKGGFHKRVVLDMKSQVRDPRVAQE